MAGVVSVEGIVTAGDGLADIGRAERRSHRDSGDGRRMNDGFTAASGMITSVLVTRDETPRHETARYSYNDMKYDILPGTQQGS